MARRSEHTLEQLREMVLNAAKHIITEEGLAALTVRKIALEIGYTVGTIYMVFANMQELVLYVKADTLEELIEQTPNITLHNPIEPQIFALADYYLSFASQNYNRWYILFGSDLTASKQIPDWYQEKIELTYQPMTALLEQLCPHYNKQDTALAAKVLCSSIHGICLMALNGHIKQTNVENSKILRVLVNNFVKGWK